MPTTAAITKNGDQVTLLINTGTETINETYDLSDSTEQEEYWQVLADHVGGRPDDR